jgi:hypothetical protein
MYFILNEKDYELDINCIELKPGIKVSNNCLKIPISMKIKNKKRPFLIQSPKMYIPFGLNSNYNNKSYYLDLSFRGQEYNNNLNIFYKLLKRIRSQIKSLVISEKLLKQAKNIKPTFIDSIKKDLYGERLTTKLNYISGEVCLNIYNNQKKLQTIEDIQKGLYAISILHLSDIWFSLNEKGQVTQYGLTWVVMQLKLFHPLILKKYCIIDDDDRDEIESKKNEFHRETKKELISIPEENKIKNHQIYKVYFNMIKYGIPIGNIKQKMVFNGHDPNIIDLNPDNEIPNSLKNIGNKNKLNLNTNLLKSIQLKDMNTREIPEEYTNKNKSQSKGPSLEEILGSIKSLKKTDIQNKYINTNLYNKNLYLDEKYEKKTKNPLLDQIQNYKPKPID